MANACVASRYFSGQGTLLLGERDAAGNPQGLRPVGNVAELTLGIEIEEFEHRESCTGARGIDATLITEVSVGVNFTLESFTKENLALVLFGSGTDVASGSATDEAVDLYGDGRCSPLANMKVSSVVVEHAEAGADDYTTAGFGGGAAVALNTYVTNVAGTAILKATTAGTDGGGGEPAWDLTDIGDTTADGTVVWTYVSTVAALVLDTDYTLDTETGAIEGVSGQVVDGEPYLVDYDYEDQEDVQGFLTSSKPLRYARFQGLNTAEAGNPVVVNVFKLEVSPLAELALINDEFSQAEVEAEALSDALRTGAGESKFFEIRLVKDPNA